MQTTPERPARPAAPPPDTLLSTAHTDRDAVNAINGARPPWSRIFYVESVRRWTVPAGVPLGRFRRWLPGWPAAGERLNVSYNENDAAKKAGAWWYPRARTWYAPAGADVCRLARWLPTAAERAEAGARSRAAEAARAALEEAEEAAARGAPPDAEAPPLDVDWRSLSRSPSPPPAARSPPPSPPPPPRVARARAALFGRDFTCSMCFERLDDPAKSDPCTTACGHSFHRGCLAMWVNLTRAELARPMCPDCRAHIHAMPAASVALRDLLRMCRNRDAEDEAEEARAAKRVRP